MTASSFLAGTTPISVDVVGWYRDTEDSGEVLRYRIEDLVAAEPAVVPSVYRVSIVDGADAADVGSALAEQVGPAARSAVLDTGRADLEPLMMGLRLIAGVLFLTAGINLFSTLLTSSRGSVRRTGVKLSLGFTPRQLIGQGAVAGAVVGIVATVATVIGIPLGLLIFRLLADSVSSGIGTGPGWLPAPSIALIVVIAVVAIALSVSLGALAVRRIATRPAAELVRGE